MKLPGRRATKCALALWVPLHARLTAHARGRRSFFYSVTNWSAIESAQSETAKTQTTTANTIHINCPAADRPTDGCTCNTQEKWWLDGHGQAATTTTDMHSFPRCVNGQAKSHDSTLATPTATTALRIKANTCHGTGNSSVTIGNSTLQICSNGSSQRLPIPGGSNNKNNGCFLTMLVVAVVVAMSALLLDSWHGFLHGISREFVAAIAVLVAARFTLHKSCCFCFCVFTHAFVAYSWVAFVCRIDFFLLFILLFFFEARLLACTWHFLPLPCCCCKLSLLSNCVAIINCTCLFLADCKYVLWQIVAATKQRYCPTT